ncbi:restriction endonuclease subunit S [Tidjanibacter massiliensis]|uniref:restriction endonuclease subunit S n=1 Tax=Tidjanibacter massiliensis TaxID=1871003 RepID=UPI00214C12DC|nr:restriction endonuclease subunit S [Tidjanibacter massiliensis]
MEEQDKLANFISLLDERISTQNKIIEKLETLIKGIIKTLISSQKPNTVITSCLECNSSILQEIQVTEYGAFPVYGATGITGYTEAADVNGESILIIKDGSGVGTVKYVTGEYSYIGTLNRLTAKDGYCLKYIYFALQEFSFEPYKTGMAIPHIYFKDYGKAKIFCPNLKLQFEIAKELSNINDKIEVEKQILLCLHKQKLYLLLQMFL